jgi:hypothetical protein
MKPYGLHLILTPKRRRFGFFVLYFIHINIHIIIYIIIILLLLLLLYIYVVGYRL